MYAPRPCRARAQSVVSRCPGLVVCAPRALSPSAQALSCQLCHDPTVPCRDTTSMSKPKPSSELEYQVATWEPPPMTKLCRDLVSTSYTSLYCDTKFLAASALCHNRIPLLRVHLYRACPRPIVRSWPGLSRAPGLVCRGQLCHDLKILCPDIARTYLSCTRLGLVVRVPRALFPGAQALSCARPELCRRVPKPCRANSATTQLCHVVTRPLCQNPNLVAN